MRLIVKNDRQRIVRIVFGISYILSLFSPLAAYHSLGTANVYGILWAFMTPPVTLL